MTEKYICANAFINVLKERQKEFGGCQRAFGKTATCVLEETINKLQSFQAADVAPVVHAHWMPKEHWVPLARDASPWSYDEDRYDYETHSQKELYWHCSNCDCIKSRIVKPVVPFCEQCGAKMDENMKEEAEQ